MPQNFTLEGEKEQRYMRDKLVLTVAVVFSLIGGAVRLSATCSTGFDLNGNQVAQRCVGTYDGTALGCSACCINQFQVYFNSCDACTTETSTNTCEDAAFTWNDTCNNYCQDYLGAARTGKHGPAKDHQRED